MVSAPITIDNDHQLLSQLGYIMVYSAERLREMVLSIFEEEGFFGLSMHRKLYGSRKRSFKYQVECPSYLQYMGINLRPKKNHMTILVKRLNNRNTA